MALEAVPEGATVLGLGVGPAHIAETLRGKGCEATLVGEGTSAIGEGIQVVPQDLDQPLDVDL